jgi:16S rRNA C967 or C1407 C5-methylase (RsmB/RsmF family)
VKPPADFVVRVRPLFPEDGEAFSAFLASFDDPPSYGVRANPPRMTRDLLRALLPTLGEPAPLGDVPWCPDGLRLSPASAPGRHPLHDAGLFYLQEPSAMLPVEVLAPRPGERVLDLCAAPGGKSVQIAARMEGEGFLLANDLHEDRARALVRNLERCGATNAVVTAESPDRLAAWLPGFFDRILVDAPCSGEGMFRRDPASVGRWAEYADGRCRKEQDAILDAADRLLAPGGRLVYATCTFSLDEDEGTVAAFLEGHPGYRLVPVRKTEGLSDAIDLGRGLSAAVRIWPHRAPGDGHFCACLEKAGRRDRSAVPATPPFQGIHAALSSEAVDAFRRFAGPVLAPEVSERLSSWISGSRHATTTAGHVHVLPEAPPDLGRLHVLKRGFHFGSLEEDRHGRRFAPSHSLALVLEGGDALRIVDLPVEDGTALRYLKGETLSLPEPDGPLEAGGFAAATVMGFPVGWVKPMGRGMFKNLYPPGWRRR